MIYVVVTATHPDDMAAALPGQVAIATGAHDSLHRPIFRPIEDVVGAVIALLGLRVQNFTLGEVLLCDDDGREFVGAGRKPSKWRVTTETFTDLGAAVARAQQVLALADGVVM